MRHPTWEWREMVAAAHANQDPSPDPGTVMIWIPNTGQFRFVTTILKAKHEEMIIWRINECWLGNPGILNDALSLLSKEEIVTVLECISIFKGWGTKPLLNEEKNIPSAWIINTTKHSQQDRSTSEPNRGPHLTHSTQVSDETYYSKQLNNGQVWY